MKNKYLKVVEFFKKHTPYWMAHAVVALVLSIVFQHWMIGISFYAGREIRDWEKLHDWKLSGFDWKGLLAPIVACLLYHILTK